MPWLIRPEEALDPQLSLLLIHVPRCGGTSLTKHFQTAKRSREGRNCCHRCGLAYFMYRYRLLERANFPVLTIENAIACCTAFIGTVLFIMCVNSRGVRGCGPNNYAPFWMFVNAFLQFFSSTFLATAAGIGRVRFMRRAYALLVGPYPFCQPMSSIKWLVGVNHMGWLLHLTAEKVIRYGYVAQDEFDEAITFSIVRNPFSRMVSIYMYNRRPFESFESFVRSWEHRIRRYVKTGRKTDEWNVYCHVLPMHEYTHHQGKQLVRCIIQQEHLKLLKSDGPLAAQFADLPAVLLQTLRDMPHSNRRVRKKKWQNYYIPATREAVLRMYGQDFELFGYDTSIPGIKVEPSPRCTSTSAVVVPMEVSALSRITSEKSSKSAVCHVEESNGDTVHPMPIKGRMTDFNHVECKDADVHLVTDFKHMECKDAHVYTHHDRIQGATLGGYILNLSASVAVLVESDNSDQSSTKSGREISKALESKVVGTCNPFEHTKCKGRGVRSHHDHNISVTMAGNRLESRANVVVPMESLNSDESSEDGGDCPRAMETEFFSAGAHHYHCQDTTPAGE